MKRINRKSNPSTLIFIPVDDQRSIMRFFVPFFIALLMLYVIPLSAADDWKLVWQDEFDKKNVDESKWNFVLGGGGYGNNELQIYTNSLDNVAIENGQLVIRAQKLPDGKYTSVKMTTKAKGDWLYGRFEFRAKLPFGQGIWPAFWMMPSDGRFGGWPSCGEIDIMELLGHEPKRVHGTLHFGDPHSMSGASYELPGTMGFHEGFHLFMLEWEPGIFRWYVDGQLYSTKEDWFSYDSKQDKEFPFPAPFDRAFYLQMNLAVGGNWPGYPDASTVFPQTMVVDYVRVYAKETYPQISVGQKKKERPQVKARRPLNADGNYLHNGDFRVAKVHPVQGYSVLTDEMIQSAAANGSWQFILTEGGEAEVKVKKREAVISISEAGRQVWAVQLVQGPLFLEQGKRYRISFDASSDRNRRMMVKVNHIGGSWMSYSPEWDIPLGKKKTRYVHEFVMRHWDDPDTRIEFNMGRDVGTIRIGNVRIEEVKK